MGIDFLNTFYSFLNTNIEIPTVNQAHLVLLVFIVIFTTTAQIKVQQVVCFIPNITQNPFLCKDNHTSINFPKFCTVSMHNINKFRETLKFIICKLPDEMDIC